MMKRKCKNDIKIFTVRIILHNDEIIFSSFFWIFKQQLFGFVMEHRQYDSRKLLLKVLP